MNHRGTPINVTGASEQDGAPALLHEICISSSPQKLAYFGLGTLSQTSIIALLLAIPVLFPHKFMPVGRYVIAALEPTPQLYLPVRAHHPTVIRPARPLPSADPIAERRSYLPMLKSPVANPTSPRQMEVNEPELVGVSADATTAIASPIIPVLRRPPEPVQTGTFDSNSQSAHMHPPTSIDTGGFSLGAAGANRRSTAGRPGVVEGAFGNVLAVTARKTSGTAIDTPVEILELPKPVYTQEARDRKIEGEVILEVVFSSKGTVEIQRVVQTLGYGLEACAEEATRQIRFRPALKNGTPVDASALIGAKFQLVD